MVNLLPVSFRIAIITVVLKYKGIQCPVVTEEWMMTKGRGAIEGRQASTRTLGKGVQIKFQ